MKNILEIKNLSVKYWNNKVLNCLNLNIHTWEILMLVWANGTWKSTLLKSIFWMVDNINWEIYLSWKKIFPKTSDMVNHWISFVPQDFRIFPEMSVEENIKIWGYSLNNNNLCNKRFYEILNLFPKIKGKLSLKASALSWGERQIVALWRSLMLKPKLLLLDEPSLWLAPSIVSDIFFIIKEININFKTSIVIVEHNLKTLINISDRAIILVKWKIIKECKPRELLHSKMLENVFLGGNI